MLLVYAFPLKTTQSFIQLSCRQRFLNAYHNHHHAAENATCEDTGQTRYDAAHYEAFTVVIEFLLNTLLIKMVL
jgi:hypothetical protein